MGVQLTKLIGQGLNNTIITGGLVPKGAYNASTDYAVGDSVDYNGSSYVMHTDAAAGTVPTNTTYWQILAEKGDTGPQGEQGIQGETGPAGASTPRRFTSLNFESTTRYTLSVNGTSSSNTFGTNGLSQSKGTDATGGAAMRYSGNSAISLAPFDKNPEIYFSGKSSAASAGNTWEWYMVYGGIGTASTLSPTTKHMGFLCKNNNGTQQIYATHSDGTTQTTTLLSSSNFTANGMVFFAKMTSGTDIKFYVNGTLEATHTTNLPTGGFANQFEAMSIIKASAGTTNNSVELYSIGYSSDLI